MGHFRGGQGEGQRPGSSGRIESMWGHCLSASFFFFLPSFHPPQTMKQCECMNETKEWNALWEEGLRVRSSSFPHYRRIKSKLLSDLTSGKCPKNWGSGHFPVFPTCGDGRRRFAAWESLTTTTGTCQKHSGERWSHVYSLISYLSSSTTPLFHPEIFVFTLASITC